MDENLLNWPDNWDGRGSAKPKAHLILVAQCVLFCLYSFADKENLQLPKYCKSADEQGNVVLEWWGPNRKLTIEVNDDSGRVHYRLFDCIHTDLSFHEAGILEPKNESQWSKIFYWLLDKKEQTMRKEQIESISEDVTILAELIHKLTVSGILDWSEGPLESCRYATIPETSVQVMLWRYQQDQEESFSIDMTNNKTFSLRLFEQGKNLWKEIDRKLSCTKCS